MTEAADATRWADLDLDSLVCDDVLSGFDLSTLPEPQPLPLIVAVDDPALVASLERAAVDQGVSVGEIVQQRLRGAA